MSTNSRRLLCVAALCCAAVGSAAATGSAMGADGLGSSSSSLRGAHLTLAQRSGYDDAWIVTYGKGPQSLDNPWTQRKFEGPTAEQDAMNFCLRLEQNGYDKSQYTMDRAPIAAISE
jgi:hypothetical protein